MAHPTYTVDGKKYTTIYSYHTKASAKEYAAKNRKAGFLSRVVYDPTSDVIHPWVVVRRPKG